MKTISWDFQVANVLARSMTPLTSKTFDKLIIFEDVAGATTPAGLLQVVSPRESAFTYATSWRQAGRRPIDPVNLSVRPRAHHSAPASLPLVLYDSCPDGWGKGILESAFPDHRFRPVDYLAAAGHERTGSLQVGFDVAEGPRSWRPSVTQIRELPPLDMMHLEDLMAAAKAQEEGEAAPEHIQLLFRGSADVGGVRPKARLMKNGEGWIAKFPGIADPFDDPRAEALSLDLAAECKIDVPEHDMIELRKKAVLLVKRFDRGPQGRRYGYMSAATLVGEMPGGNDDGSTYTYADVAIGARKFGFAPCEEEIFRRMVFYAFIHCTDDHLRNTAFIRRGDEWSLSPVFDVVPHKKEVHTTRASRGTHPIPDPARVFESFPAFKLERGKALEIYDEIVAGVRRLPEFLDRRNIASKDRRTLMGLMAHALNPPAVQG
ncbi:MAG: type II toxin-antitoxin system HipA family toxin [Rhodospirillaceae bacterium]|nr:type II toxin-antitoxin system HipA family toxin [Rhodospirillaceae bacterium]